MIRRGLALGFLDAWAVGLGACSGDFLWALGVALGAGAVINVPGVRVVLGGVSICLLLLLAWIFARGAWRAWLAQRSPAFLVAGPAPMARLQSPRGGYVLGLGMALTSPWNIAFWLAVIGSQTAGATPTLASSLLLASAVVAGAASWGTVLCGALSLGARFATPAWQIGTSAATAALMLYFALHALARLYIGS
jgi:threonine/homoserine/homoserine lactone efflux protein